MPATEPPSTSANAAELIQRLEQIETKLSFAEHSIAELEDTVASQQRELESLTRQNEALKTRCQALQELAERGGIEPGDERPPHY